MLLGISAKNTRSNPQLSGSQVWTWVLVEAHRVEDAAAHDASCNPVCFDAMEMEMGPGMSKSDVGTSQCGEVHLLQMDQLVNPVALLGSSLVAEPWVTPATSYGYINRWARALW